MLKYEKNIPSLKRLTSTSLTDAMILERTNLQAAIVNSWEEFREEIGMPELIYLSQGVKPHSSCNDELDILALDEDGHLVVIELKRGSQKLHLLQAISYAGMISSWSTEDFVHRVKYGSLANAEEITRLVELERIDFANPRIILLAESFEPEVILSSNWLAQYQVPILIFSISPIELEGEIMLSIVQKFPLPELEDVYRARTAQRVQAGPQVTWEEALTRLTLPFAKHAIDVLTEYKPGDTARRRFVSMFSDSDFGGMELNLTNKHVKAYIHGQTEEKVDSIKRAMGDDFPFLPWGNDQTAKSGFSLALRTKEEFDRFVAYAKASTKDD